MASGAETLVLITTDHWVREWFDVCLLAPSRHSGKPVEFFDISTGSSDDHVVTLAATLTRLRAGGGQVMCFACTDSAMDVYSSALESLRQTGQAELLRGASFVCFFLATHKLAARRAVAGADGLKCKPVYMDDPMLPDLGVTGFFKPLAECGSKGVMRVEAGASVANPLKGERSTMFTPTKLTLAKSYSEVAPYLDDTTVGLVEEYVLPSCRKVSIDGYVHEGKIHHYMISANIYVEGRPEEFDSLVTPAQSLTQLEIVACWKLYDMVANDMIRRGLDFQFFDVEAFVMPAREGKDKPRIEVMEVNCRTFSNQLPVFAKLYGPKSCMFSAAVDLLAGRAPPIPADFAEQFMRSASEQTGDIALGVCTYFTAIEGAPTIVQSDDGKAVLYSVPGYPAHVYAFGREQEATRRLCDTFYEQVKSMCGEGGIAEPLTKCPRRDGA